MAKIIMITSGKGGVGKSSVCAGIGYHLACLGKKTLALEMDSGLRCLDVLLGVSETTVHDVSDVLRGRCEPIKAIYNSPLSDKLDMMPATMRPGEEYSSKLFHKLCKGLCRYYEYILIETPAGFGRPLADISSVANLALLVVTPDPVSVRDAKVVSDYLDTRGLRRQRIIINKVIVDRRGKLNALPNLDAVLDTVMEPLIGVVPYEPEMTKLLAQGKAIPVKYLAGQAMQNIARRITGDFVDLVVS